MLTRVRAWWRKRDDGGRVEAVKPQRPKAPTREELQARLRRSEYLTDVEYQIAINGYYWPHDYNRIIVGTREEESP